MPEQAQRAWYGLIPGMKMDKQDKQNVDRISEQAALWMVRLNNDDLSERIHQEFRDWLAENPAHGEEFSAVSSMWAAMDEIQAVQQLKLHNIAHHQVFTPRPGRKLKTALALAACLLVTVALVKPFNNLMNPSPSYFTTEVGETRTVNLEDGSVVHLNTRSKLAWSGNEENIRKAVLLQGEALFDIEPDPAHPFLVEAGSGVIRVLGTRFNVYLKSNADVVVTVLEGSVKVEDATKNVSQKAWERNLLANQEILYRDTGVKVEVKEAPAFKKVSWRDGIIILEDLPLMDVVDELSRYSDRRIIIGDSRLNELRIGGVVGIKDIRKALAFLEEVAPIQVSESNGLFVLNYSPVNP